jgi:hypothetical protein
MDRVLVILAAVVFVASIATIAWFGQRAEAKARHRRWREREEHLGRRRGPSIGVKTGSNGHVPVHGMIVARLAESLAGQIELGGQTVFLRDGETCAYTVGTPIRVVYTVVDGQRLVDGIMHVPSAE